MDQPDPGIVRLTEACHANARDLHRAASNLRAEGLPNIAYHLAVLALEELGKAQLIGIGWIAEARGEDSSWHQKQIDDHVKKLFWALWGPTLTRRRPDNKEINALRDLATTIHSNRLRGLYVSSDPANLELPKDAISEQSLSGLMNLRFLSEKYN